MTDKNRQKGNEIGDADAGGLAKDIDARQVLSQARSSAFDDCIFAIRGAIAFGIRGTNAPPDGHWLAEFYDIGKKLARTAPEALGAAKGVELTDAELKSAAYLNNVSQPGFMHCEHLTPINEFVQRILAKSKDQS